MEKVLFTASATATGGREGTVKSSDGIIDLNLAMPKKDAAPSATNPEQLFAAGYSACFDSALNLVAMRKKQKIESAVTAEVSLLSDAADGGYKIGVTLNVEVKGTDMETAKQLVEAAHHVCPYSKATRGNIEVSLNVK
ncbi:organic hydroperoxide resistance protein [Longirhabdus pacifica]|uniref:organic hydroperoxide resistance protein n=1 Tax=Longirhabdus pacifica TaxID=2305227 RepID=UPI00100878BC|nr:organic hydroperoxide resistance protein [Longirhabdus pacifica]